MEATRKILVIIMLLFLNELNNLLFFNIILNVKMITID